MNNKSLWSLLTRNNQAAGKMNERTKKIKGKLNRSENSMMISGKQTISGCEENVHPKRYILEYWSQMVLNDFHTMKY